MTPRALILAGTLVCAAALALAIAGATLRGALNPECSFCAPWQARVLLFLALPVGIYGGLLVAMGIVRAQPDEREQG